MSANVCKEMTRRDVAKAAGVSMATVSRSLNDSTLIPESTRKRVRGIADQLGFEFNAHARSLITRRVGTIGIILPPDFDRFGVNLHHATLHNSLREKDLLRGDMTMESGYDLVTGRGSASAGTTGWWPSTT